MRNSGQLCNDKIQNGVELHLQFGLTCIEIQFLLWTTSQCVIKILVIQQKLLFLKFLSI